jgi:hypothetical protein
MKAILQWVLRTMMKDQTGIVKTMPKKDLVDFNVAMTAERLMRNGIDPNSLKNANQVENAINQIEAPRNVQQGIKSTKSAKVFDLEGKEIDPKKGIMGGKAVDLPDDVDPRDTILPSSIIDDLPPPGSRGGPDDIAAPVMNVEDAPEGFIDFVRSTDPEGAAKLQKEENRIKAKIEAANKRAIENLKKKKKKKDDDPEDMAQGGRAGFKDGMDRRTFMKIMGGLATLPILGKFVKPAMPLIKKGAELSAPALDKIIEVVMSAGKLVSQSGRRLKELTTKKKLNDIEVEEDMMDGPSYTIKTKDKTIYYRPGRQDEGGLEDDIIEVIEDTVTKKASGGIARMLGE